MKEDEMRSIIITAEDDFHLLDKLSELQKWKLEKFDLPGSFKYCLTNGETKITIRSVAKNVIQTVNVLPHDSNDDQVAANNALKSLSIELSALEIRNAITASGRDLA